MVNLDDLIGNLLLDLQKNDPETFAKLMKKAKQDNPDLFEDDDVDIENQKIDEYNRMIDEHNRKIDES